ncbi:MAG: energy transducer TonB [Acidobacteriota bacterium]
MQAYAFVDSSQVITAEEADEHTFVVNFINLTDYVLVIQPADFIYRGASGRHYIGQVYELKHQDPLGNMQKYTASVLVKGHSFTGLNVVGLFLEKDSIEELSVRIGSRRFYLQGLESAPFEELLRKIEDLDLNSTDISEEFRELNMQEMGYVNDTDGSDEWDRDWEGLIVDGINPVRIIENPAVHLQDVPSNSKDDMTVRVSGVVNRNGGIQNLKVIKGINRKLDQLVLDSISNSWVFLPATKNGEVQEYGIEFTVNIGTLFESQSD